MLIDAPIQKKTCKDIFLLRGIWLGGLASIRTDIILTALKNFLFLGLTNFWSNFGTQSKLRHAALRFSKKNEVCNLSFFFCQTAFSPWGYHRGTRGVPRWSYRGTTEVPRGYHRGTRRVPQGFQVVTTGVPQGYHGGTTEVPPGYPGADMQKDNFFKQARFEPK